LPAVPTIGFPRSFTVMENGTTDICVMLMPHVTLTRDVAVTLATEDGTAEGNFGCRAAVVSR